VFLCRLIDTEPARGRVANKLVRFPSAVTASITLELLMALDERDGEPKFRELEPARRVAAAG
jgi:hypothetical protein